MSENILQNTEFDYTIKALPVVPNVLEREGVDEMMVIEESVGG
jgi:hypothetical protein